MCEKPETKRKTLQELTIKSSFMFAAVMLDEENAKGFLERAIGVKIKSVKVHTEKTLVYNPEYKGVRLDVEIEDGSHTIFLSTKGTNDGEEPKELVKFLKYVGASLEESRKDYGDELVKHLQESVEKVKRDREMGRLFMMEIYQRDFFKAGKDAGIIEGKIKSIIQLLSKLAPVPDNLKERISSVTDEAILDELLWKAARAESVSDFDGVLNEMHL